MGEAWAGPIKQRSCPSPLPTEKLPLPARASFVLVKIEAARRRNRCSVERAMSVQSFVLFQMLASSAVVATAAVLSSPAPPKHVERTAAPVRPTAMADGGQTVLTKAVQTVMTDAGSSNEDGSKNPAITPQWQEGVIPESMTPTASIGADIAGLQQSNKYRDLEEGYRTVRRTRYLLAIADLNRSLKDLTEQIRNLQSEKESLVKQIGEHDRKFNQHLALIKQISFEVSELNSAARK